MLDASRMPLGCLLDAFNFPAKNQIWLTAARPNFNLPLRSALLGKFRMQDSSLQQRLSKSRSSLAFFCRILIMQAAISANRAGALGFFADAAAHFSRGSRGCAVAAALLDARL